MLTSQQFYAEAATVARSASTMRSGTEPEPADPEALLREQAQALEPFAPSLGTAAALVGLGFPVLPVDRDSLAAVGREPICNLPGVLEHWTHSRADGVAVFAGPQPNGDVLLCVRTTRPAWTAWLREHAIDRLSFTDDDGREVVRENPRPLGAPVGVRWSPPPSRPRTIAAAGMAAIVREFSAAALDPARAVERQPLLVAWNVATAWSVMPTIEASAVHGGVRKLPKFRSRREMAEHTAWSLAADGLFVNPVLDTYRMHSAEVGRVVVRAGQHETPAELLVLVQQCEDVDGTAGGSTGPLVSLHEPQWWSEDFTLDEAEQLARLLRAARDLVAR